MTYRTSRWRYSGPDLVEATPVDPTDRAAVIRDRLNEIRVCEWSNSCAYTLSTKVEEANRPLREEARQLRAELAALEFEAFKQADADALAASDNAARLLAKATALCVAAVGWIGIGWFALVVTP